MNPQERQSQVKIFGFAIRRSVRTRIQGALFLILGLGCLGSALLRDGPLAGWAVVRVVLGVLAIVFGLLLLLARVVDPTDTQRNI